MFEKYKKTVVIEGMKCNHCFSKVKVALHSNLKAKIINNTVYIKSKTTINDNEIINTIENLGYKVRDIK